MGQTYTVRRKGGISQIVGLKSLKNILEIDKTIIFFALRSKWWVFPGLLKSCSRQDEQTFSPEQYAGHSLPHWGIEKKPKGLKSSTKYCGQDDLKFQVCDGFK